MSSADDAARVSVHDRGFNYGDGVFETILVVDGQPVWWDAHLARLRHGCARLGIAFPEHSVFVPGTVAAKRSALKIVVTRGVGERGYSPANAGEPTVVVTEHEAPAPLQFVAVRWCDLRLAPQPALAGLKHLNRLENVLARGEWSDPAIGEGLLRDADDRVICATAANVFVVRDGEVLTPRLDRCGVAGITRAWVMAQLPVAEAELTRTDIESADELFLTSSLRGILPVTRLGSREWTPGPVTRRLQGRLPA